MTANIFSFTNRENKELIRQQIIESAKKTFKKRDLKILTLMGEDTSFIENLSNHFSQAIYVSAENDKNIYETQKKLINKKKLKVDLQFGDVKEHLIQTANQYKLIWLDFCSTPCEKVERTIEQAILKADVSDGPAILGVTLTGIFDKNTIARYAKGNLETKKKLQEIFRPAIWNSFANTHGKSLIPHSITRYGRGKDENGKTQMAMIYYQFKVIEGFEMPNFNSIPIIDRRYSAKIKVETPSVKPKVRVRLRKGSKDGINS